MLGSHIDILKISVLKYPGKTGEKFLSILCVYTVTEIVYAYGRYQKTGRV